ncbi:hypothetical protein N5P37_002405 [Trichoderma harzianum]|uniref:Vegetative cell wall protein gp1 n=2 Tax=Trichoderma TaxID=5543 RepID=A0A2T4AFS8_TRIHA|nr:hypothetical protein M431DRAFT_494202 [Trichoderma harzianum CBS 226.95]KAF3067967.1 hypothetical protein CFAM422_008148 [Trichoderma lentiforme]KAK0764933.1 hypothetical protein N5P37_002405 [Trichoderma harzianum]PKK54659.1 hypothetical protein CI102_633 [Trichoderma harzianum]PTB55768.1 hypothetical protein M431DRAFT_494202 [Trichoderma harzianum CBS 226.95]
MNYPSPRTPGSTPIHEWEYTRMSSATPTPSPRPSWLETTPRRPATRAAHSRASSYSQAGASTPRAPVDSPRYNSSGQYATVDVSPKYFSSSRGPSGSFQIPAWHDRRFSHTYVRATTPFGESDEDEIFEASGRTYVLLAESRTKGRRNSHHVQDYEGIRYTNHDDYPQGTAAYYADYSRDAYDSPQSHIPPTHVRPPTSHGHARRSSAAANVPQRPSTVRPSTQAYRTKAAAAAATTPKATEADARKHRIPTGYSLKNWDPSEEPILLLGSVFDANSLGKWIYDWTVYRAGANSPIADMAGELWLLLIQLSGKVKRAEDIVGRVRSTENREIMTDFIDAGERLTEKLRGLLKACEAPMLKAAKKKQSGLGKNSGVEFVDTLFGRDRELAKTEKFMQSVRLFSLRFDANCEGILQNPSS